MDGWVVNLKLLLVIEMSEGRLTLDEAIVAWDLYDELTKRHGEREAFLLVKDRVKRRVGLDPIAAQSAPPIPSFRQRLRLLRER